MCVAEQKFLNSFFHFERTEGILEESEDVEASSADEADGVTKEDKVLKSSEDVYSDMGSQNLLNQLFAALLPEIEEFIDFGERQDN